MTIERLPCMDAEMTRPVATGSGVVLTWTQPSCLLPDGVVAVDGVRYRWQDGAWQMVVP